MNLAERLGHPAEARVLILNADDVGSTHAANVASFECLDRGSLTSGSILVPAPWFREAAAFAKERPDLDFGIHLTLTSEYTPYRWRPLTDRSAGPGLYDEEGFMWRTAEEAVEHVSLEEAERELRAQIETALAAGIDVTHLDTHMGTVVQPKFIEVYVSLGLEYGIPLFTFRPDRERLRRSGNNALWEALATQLQRLDEAGFPVVDNILTQTMGKDRDFFKQLFSELRPGVTHFLVHPAKRSEETGALSDDASLRHIDYETFRDRSMAEELERLGIVRTTYQEIREAWRSGALA